MSKKRTPEAPHSTDLVEARVVREEDWALEAWRARTPFPVMRTLSLLPVEQGGLGYPLSESALRSLVQSARARHGDTTMTRADRIERQQAEIDERARRARYDLERAHAAANEPRPLREQFDDDTEYGLALGTWVKMTESAAKMVESADRRLAAAMKDEREIHGDNAATKIEAEVTTRDAVADELAAMLERIPGRAKVDS